jgi:hypothetical protein
MTGGVTAHTFFAQIVRDVCGRGGMSDHSSSLMMLIESDVPVFAISLPGGKHAMIEKGAASVGMNDRN